MINHVITYRLEEIKKGVCIEGTKDLLDFRDNKAGNGLHL